MSLIGPRPDPPDWLEKYPEDVKVFLNVKPGITGYSQYRVIGCRASERKIIDTAVYQR